MITVRFATGFSVQYNDLQAMKWDNDGMGMTLYETAAKRDAGTGWKVHVPADCIVELVQPCRTYSAVRDETTETVRALMQSEFKTIQRQIRALKKSK